MSNSLEKVINEHTERVIRETWFDGVQYGIEIGRRVLNNIKIEDKEQEKERQAALDKLYERFKLKEKEKETQ